MAFFNKEHYKQSIDKCERKYIGEQASPYFHIGFKCQKCGMELCMDIKDNPMSCFRCGGLLDSVFIDKQVLNIKDG